MGFKENPDSILQRNFEKLCSTRLYRPGITNPDFSFSTRQWAKPIDHLLAAKYAFLPSRYFDEGYLFRGMQTGAKKCIAGQSFGHFDGDDELCMVEQAMAIYFLTHEISDAVSVSRLFENSIDGCIIAIKAKIFNDYLDSRKAAVLGIGDGGIVFRYPFITSPLTVSEVAYLFVTPSFKGQNNIASPVTNRIIPVEGHTRKELENNLVHQFNRLGITPAYPIVSDIYPRPF